MAFRFVQVFIPQDLQTQPEKLLEGYEILGTWRDDVSQSRVVLHLLVSAEETEPIMDKLEQAYQNTPGFQVVLTPVEAVLPRPKVEQKQDEQSAAGKTEEKPKETARISREELYHDILENINITRVFVAMTILSAVVAAIGLMRNETAVIVGAMVIAPVLGPNIAMSLATTLGDSDLLRRSFTTNFTGIALTILFSIFLGMALDFDPSVPAIASRTNFSIADLALALAAGSAGALAFTCGLSGPVIGVMVAVALVPPLVTFGMLLGAGYVGLALGALVLAGANIICINLAGVVTFLVQGVRPRTWWQQNQARKATRIAVTAWCLLLAALVIIIIFTQT